MFKNKINTLISDLGNVLVRTHPEWAAKKFSKINGLSLKENLKIMGDHIDYMKGEITPAEFAKKYINSMSLPISEKKFNLIYADIFSLNGPLINLLKKLKRKINLVMLSNVDKITDEFLEKKYPKLFTLFDNRLVLSCKTYLVKPQKEIYLLALKIAKTKPEKAVYIDDKIKYVRAAQKLGINAFQYQNLTILKNNFRKLGLDF